MLWGLTGVIKYRGRPISSCFLTLWLQLWRWRRNSIVSQSQSQRSQAVFLDSLSLFVLRLSSRQLRNIALMWKQVAWKTFDSPISTLRPLTFFRQSSKKFLQTKLWLNLLRKLISFNKISNSWMWKVTRKNSSWQLKTKKSWVIMSHQLLKKSPRTDINYCKLSNMWN